MPCSALISPAPPSRTSDRARPSRLGPLILAVVCGVVIAASSGTLVRAADFFGIFGLFRTDAADQMSRSGRISAPVLPYDGFYRPRTALSQAPSRRRRGARKARLALARAGVGLGLGQTRTMCVRLCDGYTFPVGTLARAADISAHQTACAASCPAAETRLYTLRPGQSFEEPGEAKAVADGSLYRRLKTALLFRKERVAACSCQGPGSVAERLPIEQDPTLRAGDVVVRKDGGASAFEGSGRLPNSRKDFSDYRKSRALTRSARAGVDKVIGTTQRATLAREFERGQRLREARLSGNQFREVSAPAGSGNGVRVFQAVNAPASGSGARIILIR